jgi:hypothetical protein
MKLKLGITFLVLLFITTNLWSQSTMVKLIKDPKGKKIDITIDNQFFTSFCYPDSIEKPFLYPVLTRKQIDITRGFPLNPKPGDPTDHPHHIGIWFNFENVNGLDFWNNSYAIPAAKKSQYGWIKTDQIIKTIEGPKGELVYHANWTNQTNETLVEETTRLVFYREGNNRFIDRTTTLKAKITTIFTDAKDGMLGMRLAHELQIPTTQDQKFTDSKGIITLVKGGTDKVPNGNYITSEGKEGDNAWSTRAAWCMAYGKMGKDVVSVAIIDHPKNINYPTFWHARGYGLFAANPLGEKIFTQGKSEKNLKLNPGESVTFRYRIVIAADQQQLSSPELNKLADEFGKN